MRNKSTSFETIYIPDSWESRLIDCGFSVTREGRELSSALSASKGKLSLRIRLERFKALDPSWFLEYVWHPYPAHTFWLTSPNGVAYYLDDLVWLVDNWEKKVEEIDLRWKEIALTYPVGNLTPDPGPFNLSGYRIKAIGEKRKGERGSISAVILYSHRYDRPWAFSGGGVGRRYKRVDALFRRIQSYLERWGRR